MNKSSEPAIVDIMANQAGDGESIAQLFDGARRTRRLRGLMLGVVLLVIAFLSWSVLARVDELAKARGSIEPAANVQLVQSLEGGRLSQLLVGVDELVEEGQVLARFNDSELSRDVAQTDIRRAALRVDLERWGALAENREPDFSGIDASPALINEAQRLFQQERSLYEDQIQAQLSALERLREEFEGTQEVLPSLRDERDGAADMLATITEARASRVVSELELANAERSAAAAERAVLEAESDLEELQAAIAGAQADLEAIQETIAENALTERSRILEQIEELDAEAAALSERGADRVVMAPLTGYIKQLPDTQSGAVIPPGGTVAEIVPIEGGVIMRAEVSPRDIGFITPGQRALVKIDAFDFSRFGAMEGRVAQISPTTFRDPQTGAAFYRVDVALDSAYFRGDEDRLLIPGMSGEVDIVTGNKTVFEYLMKPVFTNLDTAFSES